MASCLVLCLVQKNLLLFIEKTLSHELKKLLTIRLLMLVLNRRRIVRSMGVLGIKLRKKER